jgi:alpha-tubulin suppressor-like RCC1 family protein
MFEGQGARGVRQWSLTLLTSLTALLTFSATASVVGATPSGAATTLSHVVYHWGSFFGDELPTTHDLVETPSLITLPARVKEVATSNSTQYALLMNGTVWAWGQGDNGQLGNGKTANSFTTPVKVRFPAGVTISWMPTDALPYDGGLAVDSTGQAWGWGLDVTGALCQGNNAMLTTPVELPTFTDVTAMAGAGDHTLIEQNGTVYACGGNESGDLGNGNTTPSNSPVAVHIATNTVSQLYASYQNSGALTKDGRYYDWGYDDQDQLGSGQTGVASSTPILVSLPASVSQVALGGSYIGNGQTLVLLSDGDIYGWGNDTFGQLGDAKTTDQPTPELITPPTGVTFTQLASGGATSYGLTASGAVYAWGANSSGQAGIGQTTLRVMTPTEVQTNATQISSTANNVAVKG